MRRTAAALVAPVRALTVRPMRVIEQFVCGKRVDQSLCEDRIVVTDDFVAVLDGATDISGATYNDVAGGRFAVDVLSDTIAALTADSTAHAAVHTLSDALADALTTASGPGGGRRPSATVVIYSAHRRQVWRVGDAAFAVDGSASIGHMPIDDVTRQWRRAWTEALLLGGTSAQEVLETDPGFLAMWPLVQLQERFANTVGSQYSYGVLNGVPVPEEFVEVHDVSRAREVVLASDGYPKLLPTLAQSESYLAYALAEDPLSLSILGANRGVKPDWASFDDRSYVRLAL